MVRLIKLAQLEEQRRVLVARSEIHRRTLQLEVANVKYSAALLKQRFGVFRTLRRAWKFAGPLAGSFLARKQNQKTGGTGFMGSLLSGLKLAGELLPLFRKKTEAAPVAEPSPSERA